MKVFKRLLTLCLIFVMLLSHLNLTRIVADDSDTAGTDDTTEVTEDPVKEDGDDVYEVSDEGEDYSVEYVENDETKAIVLQGKAAEDEAFAKDVVMKETSLSEDEADELTEDVFALRGEDDDDEYERMDEYSQIEAVSIKWITEDSEGTDDQDPLLLSVVPFDDTKQSVRLQVNYSFSGEYDYLPGDITIKIPASIFKGRNDQNLGSVTLPFAMYPSTKNDFNYQLVGDYYIFTNTKGTLINIK